MNPFNGINIDLLLSHTSSHQASFFFSLFSTPWNLTFGCFSVTSCPTKLKSNKQCAIWLCSYIEALWCPGYGELVCCAYVQVCMCAAVLHGLNTYNSGSHRSSSFHLHVQSGPLLKGNQSTWPLLSCTAKWWLWQVFHAGALNAVGGVRLWIICYWLQPLLRSLFDVLIIWLCLFTNKDIITEDYAVFFNSWVVNRNIW